VIVFLQLKTRKDLAWAAAHNPFFNNEKTRKGTKIFIGVAALADRMAREFVIWSIVFSD
jgi:hypothetical protein